MDGPHGLFQAVAPHHDRDRQLAGPLRDGDDVDVLTRDRREDPARDSLESPHSLADHG